MRELDELVHTTMTIRSLVACSPGHACDENKSGDWQGVLRDHLRWSESRGDAAVTVAVRAWHLRRFICWCLSKDLRAPTAVARKDVACYQHHVHRTLKRNGEFLAMTTRLQRLIPLRVFFRWLARTGVVAVDPTIDMELPSPARRLPQPVLSLAEVERTIAVGRTRGWVGIRDCAILEAFYSTGLRRNELARLELRDLDLSNGILFVSHGKGGRDRYVPLGTRAVACISRYLTEVRPRLVRRANDETLFVHERGEPFLRHRLSDLVKRYLRAAGIKRVGACHLFRHAMATHMLDNGADVRHLQLILGHASLSTTALYTHVSIRQLKAVHARTHPAERALAGSRWRDRAALW